MGTQTGQRIRFNDHAASVATPRHRVVLMIPTTRELR